METVRSIIKKIKRRRRRTSRHSYVRKMRKYKKYKYDKKRYLYRMKRAFRKARIKEDPEKLKHGILLLKVIRRNTFINVSIRAKIKRRPKKRKRFEVRSKKRTYIRLAYATSMGQLKAYKGRARSSAIARRELALRLLGLLSKEVSSFRCNLYNPYATAISHINWFCRKGLIFRLLKRIILRPRLR